MVTGTSGGSDDLDEDAVRTIVEETLKERSASSTRRDVLKAGGLLGAAGLAGAGSASATTSSATGTLSVGSVTANTYRIAADLYGGPAGARSELVSELDSDNAGAKYRAEDTGGWYHWTGSGWGLMDGQFKSLDTDAATITEKATDASGREYPGRLSSPPETDFFGNGGWTWFNKPRAFRSDDLTIVGCVDDKGDVRIRSHNHQTGELASSGSLYDSGTGDDHNNPAVWVRESDNRIVTAYAGHHDSATRVRISTNPLDVTSWDVETQLTPKSGSNTSYAQLAEVADEGRLYLFFRDEANAPKLACRYSTDGGASWSSQINLIELPSGEKFEYFRIGTNGSDRIDFGLTRAVNGGTGQKQDIKHMFLQDGTLYGSGGGSLGSLSGLQPITSHSAATTVYDSSATGNSDVWIHDCATHSGGPELVYAELVGETEHNWRYAKWDGGQWIDVEIGSAGENIVNSSDSFEGYYSAGAVLHPIESGVVIASVGSYEAATVNEFVTHDDGQTWSQTKLSGSNTQNIRPAIPFNPDVGPHPNLPEIWMRGRYDDYSAGDEYACAIGCYRGDTANGAVVPDDGKLYVGSDRSAYIGHTTDPSPAFLIGKEGTRILEYQYSSDKLIVKGLAEMDLDGVVLDFNGSSGIKIDHLNWNKRTSSPSSPSDGDMFYADGTSWNPGSGVGYYRYDGAAYNFLG